MEEFQKTGVTELEKIFQEYKSKLEHAEQEANDIIDIAWKKAEKIIADKQAEAQQNADIIKQKAKQEGEKIVFEASSKAAEIEREANSQIRKDAKERTRKEVDKIHAEARQTAEKEAAELVENAKNEAAQIISKAKQTAQKQVSEESEAVIAEAREKGRKIYEEAMARADETSKLILEASRKSNDIFQLFKDQVQEELTEIAGKLGKARDNLEMKSILEKNEASAGNRAANVNEKFKGRRELNIGQPYDRNQIKKLVEALKQIPSVKLDGEAGTEDNFSIYLNIAEPIPLDDILQEMSLVESSDIRGNTIRLKLKSNENGT